MPRVIGIDPGTVTIDLCGLDEGRLFLGRTLPTAEALRSPQTIVEIVEAAAPDLVAGPSGYGLPLVKARTASDDDLRLAYLMPDGERGGIGGLRKLIRALKDISAPVLLTPGVIHLRSVPAFRKTNRVDMGTADKVCSVVLAIDEQTRMRGCLATEVSLILLELGGAFSAAIAVDNGQILDGVGGTAGPMGARAAGALDGEVAFLQGTVTKDMLFHGGAATVAGAESTEWLTADTPGARLARDAYLDGLLKAVAAMASVGGFDRDRGDDVLLRFTRQDAGCGCESRWCGGCARCAGACRSCAQR